MARITRLTLAFGMLGVLSVAIGVGIPCVATSQDRAAKKDQQQPAATAKPAVEQSIFMRKKLEASNQILEGLVTEDAELVTKGARILVEMSGAEKWQVQHDVLYKQFSAEFQQSAKKLLEAAEKEKFDGATLKWIDTTMKCIDCHKFVRGAHLAG